MPHCKNLLRCNLMRIFVETHQVVFCLDPCSMTSERLFSTLFLWFKIVSSWSVNPLPPLVACLKWSGLGNDIQVKSHFSNLHIARCTCTIKLKDISPKKKKKSKTAFYLENYIGDKCTFRRKLPWRNSISFLMYICDIYFILPAILD